MEPTIEFRLITFLDVAAGPFSTTRIAGKELQDRVVFARTRSGKYAKFQVELAGATLNVIRLTIYDPDGTVLSSFPQPFVVRPSMGCDLEKGVEASIGQGDFRWIARHPPKPPKTPRGGTRRPGPRPLPDLIPDPGAAFGLFIDFEAVRYNEVSPGPWSADRVDGPALKHQIIFCRTQRPGSRVVLFAKLLVKIDSISLVVKRLVVWRGRHRPVLVLDASNIRMYPSDMLDLQTGIAGSPTGDLWWQVVTIDEWYLAPRGGTTISFPSYYAFAKYLPLLRDPAIQTALSFDRPGGYAFPNLTYKYWHGEVKLQLDEYLYLLETKRPLPIAGPPAVVATVGNMPTIGWKDGRKAYLAHVAQSLWVDANQLVGWRLSRNATELEHLFDSQRLFSRAAYEYYFVTMGSVTAWNPVAAYEFLDSHALIGADQFSTIKKFADWCRSNLEHITGYNSDPNGPFASEWDQFQWYYGYGGFPPVERVLVPPAGKPHITAGCWGTSGLFAGVLRSVNIPVRHGRTNFSGVIHSRPEFISVGQDLAHGDDPYDRLAGVGHHTPPIDLIFYTDADLTAQIDLPAALPGKTVPQTTSVNHTKKFGDIAIQYKTNYLLGCRCLDIQLSASPTATFSRLWQGLHEAYTNAQLTLIAADCDTEIALLGGCSTIPPI